MECNSFIFCVGFYFVSVFLGWPWTRVEQGVGRLEGEEEDLCAMGPNNQTHACPLGGMGFGFLEAVSAFSSD